MIRKPVLAVVGSLAALLLAGCSSPSGGEAPAPSVAVTDSAGASSIAGEHNESDVMFAQMMIPHHQQAVEMSDLLLAKEDVPPEVHEFAQRVIDAQGPEITRMEQMLQTWGQPRDAAHAPQDHGSDGMMSPEDMALLEQAQGNEAGRLYLEQMTVHHEGAVAMAREQVDQGQNAQAVELASQVIAAQEAEIAEMRDLVAGLTAGS